MHIRILKRAILPGGGWAMPDQVLDLPEVEAEPLLREGSAELLPAPAEPAEPPEPPSSAA